MRSAGSIAALLLLCACGDLSNQDLAFLSAIPRREHLHIAVPSETAQPLCGPGTFGEADTWKQSKGTGDAINAGVDGILSLVDLVRTAPPSHRGEDDRTWGPWPDRNHPGVEIRVRMERQLDADRVPWAWNYVFEARRASAGYLPILEGTFFGADARGGIGRLIIRFDNSTALAMNKPDDPVHPAKIFYDLSGEPRTISFDLSAGNGLRLPQFDYFWAGYGDGHGRFDYAVPQSNGCLVTVSTWFTREGAGKGNIHFECPLNVRGDAKQCWTSAACLSYVDDPYAFTPACNGVKPCLFGTPQACPALP